MIKLVVSDCHPPLTPRPPVPQLFTMKSIFAQILTALFFLSLQAFCSPLQDDNANDHGANYQGVDTAVRTCVGVAGGLVVAQLIWNLIKWPFFAGLGLWSVNNVVNNWWGRRAKFEREMRADGLQGGYPPPRPRVIHSGESNGSQD
jgi:hypothetical protein